MEYQFITIDGISLAYLEKNASSGKTIFFIHGNSTSSRTWVKQLKSDALNDYRLIAFDLPAHGFSSSLNGSGPGYNLPGLGKIMAGAVAQMAATSPYILAGVSLGTNVIAEMLPHGIEHSGIILTGSCVIGGEFTIERIFKPGIDLHAGFSDSVPEEELRAYAKLAFSSEDENDWNDFAEDYYKVKDSFRPKIFETVLAGNYSNGIELLRNQPAPVLVIFGADEKVCDAEYLNNASLNLWKGQSFLIEGAGHFVNTDRPGIFNALVAEYAPEVFR
jgi:pimeloyl-ACP methyl ester carboxylesterase